MKCVCEHKEKHSMKCVCERKEKHSMKCVCAQSLVSASYSSHPARAYSSHPSECLRHISINICVPVHLSRFARIASLPLHLSRFARRLRLRLLILPRLPRRHARERET